MTDRAFAATYESASIGSPETPQEDAAPPQNNILWRVERMIVDTAHQMTFGTTLEREFYRGFNAAYQNVRNMLKEQPPSLLAAPEGRVREAATALLTKSPGRWVDRGYGRFSCSSCGAERMIDYGDHKQPTTKRREPCSRSCPWATLEAALAPSPIRGAK